MVLGLPQFLVEATHVVLKMQLMFGLKGKLHKVVERKVGRNLHDNVSTLNEQSTMQSTSTTKVSRKREVCWGPRLEQSPSPSAGSGPPGYQLGSKQRGGLLEGLVELKK